MQIRWKISWSYFFQLPKYIFLTFTCWSLQLITAPCTIRITPTHTGWWASWKSWDGRSRTISSFTQKRRCVVDLPRPAHVIRKSFFFFLCHSYTPSHKKKSFENLARFLAFFATYSKFYRHTGLPIRNQPIEMHNSRRSWSKVQTTFLWAGICLFVILWY